MLIFMRTTIRLPDELYDKVRQTARAQGLTVTAFIERSLQHSLGARVGSKPSPYRVDAFHGSGTQPGVDLDDNDALAELMDHDARR